jgi:hypothetical protein
MQRHHILSIALVASAINGMVSPAMVIVAIFSWVWLPPFLLGSAGTIFFVSMLVTATGSLLLAGVPAAVYERVTGARADAISLWIWAGSAVLLMVHGFVWRMA